MKTRPGRYPPMTGQWHKIILAFLAISAASLACSFSLPFSRPHPGNTPTPKAPQGRLAYVGKDGNIYITDRNGKQPLAITHDAALNPSAGQTGRVYQYLTWAPDGRHLAFVRIVVRPSGEEASVLSALSDGSQPVTNFTSQGVQPFYLFWSPDSRTIAFLGSDATTGALSQYLVPAAGGQSKMIGSGQPYYWDWSPDNSALIVHTGGAGSTNPNARVTYIGVDGTTPNRELSITPGPFEAPAWSPAGEEVALALQTDSGGNELVLAGSDGKVKRVLASLGGPVTFAWSPKGGQMAYSVYDSAGSAFKARLVVLDSEHPDQYSQVVEGAVVAFFWSPDGKKIVYFVVESGGIHSSAFQLAAQTTARVTLDAWVYDRDSGTAKQVAAFAPTDAFLQIITYNSQYQRSDTIWSPDSQALVLSGVDADGQNAIYTVGADGSLFQKIADGDIAFWAWK